MFRKKINRYRFVVCCLSGLLAFGCAAAPQGAEESETGSQIPVSVPAQSADGSSAADEISLVFDGNYEVADGLLFQLPDGWEAVQDEKMNFSAVSETGAASVDASFLPLDNLTGITEQLLVSETAAALAQAWREAGGTQVEYNITTVSVAGEAHAAIRLSAQKNGHAVYQLQWYLLRVGGVFSVTVTAEREEDMEQLLEAFSGA